MIDFVLNENQGEEKFLKEGVFRKCQGEGATDITLMSGGKKRKCERNRSQCQHKSSKQGRTLHLDNYRGDSQVSAGDKSFV